MEILMQVVIEPKIDKFLEKQLKKDTENIRKVRAFLIELENAKNPLALNNVEKVQRKENHWRWKVAKYRIIGEVLSGIATIKIVKIDRRKEDTYEGF